MEQAKKEIYNLLLNNASTRYGFNTVIKYIAEQYKVSYADLKKWADQQKDLIAQNVENLIYHKVEIHVEEKVSEDNYYDIALDKKKTFEQRKDAINKITDDKTIIQLFQKLENNLLKKELIKKHIYEVFELALKEKDADIRIKAIKGIHSQLKLRWAVEETNNLETKLEAIKKLKDPHSLQKILLYEKEAEVRKAALHKITNVSLLESLRKQIETSFLCYVDARIKQLKQTNIKNQTDPIKESIEQLIKKYK